MKTKIAVALMALFTVGAGVLMAQTPAAGEPVREGFFPPHFWGDLTAMFAFGFVAIFLVMVGYKVFDWLTPKCNYETQIAAGNNAAAITVAAVILGSCYVIAQVMAAVIN